MSTDCEHTLAWSIAGTYCTKCRETFTIDEILPLAEKAMRDVQLQYFFDSILTEIGWSDEDEDSDKDPMAYCIDQIRGMQDEIKERASKGVTLSRCSKCGSFSDNEKFVYCDNCGNGL